MAIFTMIEAYKTLLKKDNSNNFFSARTSTWGANFFASLYETAFRYSEYFSPQDLRNIQLERERKILQSARRMPAYVHFFFRNRFPDKLENFPITPKAAMRKLFEETRTASPLEKFQIPQFTSGSTGIPFSFFLDKRMLPARRAVYRRMLRWAGKTSEDTVILLMPRQHPGLESENFFFPCGAPGDIDKKIKEIFALFEGKSVILQARASHLRRLAQLLEKQKRKFLFKALISYTEQLTPGLREFLKKIFQAPVFDYYACNEITAIAQECEMHEGLHINSEWVVLEIVDERGNVLPEGCRGDILVTSLFNHVMPFLRYKLGDKGYLLQSPCACGRTLPRVVVDGREEASFILPNGSVGHLGDLMAPIIARLKTLSQYQVQRNKIDSFTIRIVPLKELGLKDIKLIQDQFQAYLGGGVKVTIELVDQIAPPRGGKEANFINKVGTIPLE